MCMFSGPVIDVNNTKIFAKMNKEGKQLIVYQNKFATKNEVAMILPIPEKHGKEESITFINLKEMPEFFEDLYEVFAPISKGFGRGVDMLGIDKSKLKVHTVGSFEASFVPRRKDFDRLDDMFRLEDSIWDNFSEYESFGFVVFQFKAGENEPHPMAFSFESNRPNEVFFPTIHVHDGKVYDEEYFDHTLYTQAASDNKSLKEANWENQNISNNKKLQKYISKGLLVEDQLLWRETYKGKYTNKDLIIPV